MKTTTVPEATRLLYWDDTYRTTAPATLIGFGDDERGFYLLLDQTLAYPQSGGQPADEGTITLDGEAYTLTDVRYAGSHVRHYGDVAGLRDRVGEPVEVHINRDVRLAHAALHTAGHWLAAVVAECLEVPADPVRAHHFPLEAYVAFVEREEVDWDDVLDQLSLAMLVDRQSGLLVSAEVVESSGDGAAGPGGRASRLVQIGPDYTPVGCGGTHLGSVREVGIVEVTRVKRKNGQVRLSYSVA